MRTLLSTITALVAFAANSLLNRAALATTEMAPATFTGIRLISGAVVLGLLVHLRKRRFEVAGSWISAASLLLYAVAFSYAYVSLDAGAGALILFGGVQITMFGGALLSGEKPGGMRWLGSSLGLAGLAVLFLPGAGTPSAGGILLMLAAAFGWGVYSLRGRGAAEPLITTAGNFVRLAPAGGLLLVIGAGESSLSAIALASASGALASGLGYSVWYAALRGLDASLAAIAQLSVPLIALAGGMLLLGEEPTPAFLAASLLILGGVALAVLAPRRS